MSRDIIAHPSLRMGRLSCNVCQVVSHCIAFTMAVLHSTDIGVIYKGLGVADDVLLDSLVNSVGR